ncbi:Inner membrane protein translocase and chaperone YidC, long form [hydrothermal vent metagenome]|uniref:Membrane protein insertase YidC n=1 Tax=hydrothermal vent metagenome TaxID=652676 RepID=A0A3B0V5Z5_9ZZZZ
MNNPKNMLLIALFFLGFLLYMEWQQDYGPASVVNSPDNSVINSTISQAQTDDIDNVITTSQQQKTAADVPTVSTVPDLEPAQPEQTTRTTDSIITITTNVLKLKIDTMGGSMVYAELLKYPVSKKSSENIILFNQEPQTAYFAQSGLLSPQQRFVHTDLYTAEQASYEISSGFVDIPLSIEKNGIRVTKTYRIEADSYLIELTDQIQNNTGTIWQGQQYRQLQRTNPWLNNTPSFNDPSRMSFKGAAYFEPNEGFTQLDFSDFAEDKINLSFQQEGWIAMLELYFFTSFITKDAKTDIVSKYLPNSQTPYLIRATSDFATAQAGGNTSISTQLYIGPKIQDQLPLISKGLDLTVDYGIFTVISKPLFWILNKIHSVVGNWGWSIIFLTILIKLLFFKLTEKQYNSMARMRKLQPRIKTLKERHKDNKKKFNEEMMGLYKKEKVNPMGGCLPMLVQIPVFIALYWVLIESVELRQAPFMLWLQDLSSPDPFFILPAINAAAMYMTQKLSPTPGMDPMQAKIMKFMPIGFSVLFAFFHSGLVLYWAVNSSLSLLQQWTITKKIDAAG